VTRSDDGYCGSYRRDVTARPCHTQLVRPPPSVVVVAVAMTVVAGAAILTGCGSGDDDGRSAEEFCAEVAANVAAIVTPPLATEDDVDATLDLYREMANMAPLAIEEEWRDLLFSIETASTLVPDDPDSMQRAVAVAFATEKSAVAVRSWILANCGVDIGPVTTIAPQDPAATTTLPTDVSTSIVTVGEPTTTPAPDVPATPPPVDVPPATGAAG
jgi:hypothetical protein